MRVESGFLGTIWGFGAVALEKVSSGEHVVC